MCWGGMGGWLSLSQGLGLGFGLEVVRLWSLDLWLCVSSAEAREGVGRGMPTACAQ